MFQIQTLRRLIENTGPCLPTSKSFCVFMTLTLPGNPQLLNYVARRLIPQPISSAARYSQRETPRTRSSVAGDKVH